MIKRASFAVVGHPNKGKSSIVSTLCQNDSVLISSRSGTTVAADRYRVDLDNAGYELIDTPGFQRPRKVLKWLQSKAKNSAERASAVKAFCEDPECQARYPDEVELLSPIVKGAAILYVVDGSRPFGIEYEAEMEILQWTGQSSMALINPIENESHVEEWKSALAQFFKTVRVFNPMTADFQKQISLLETFAFLNSDWERNLKQVVNDLQNKRAQQKRDCAEILSRLLEDLSFYFCSQKVLNESQAKSVRPVLEEKYRNWMVNRESKAVKELLAIYSHREAQLDISEFDIPPHLFDQSEWFMWGLNKKQLAATAAVAGAAAGAAVDMAVAGHSFMLGALGGGLAGFGSAWFGSKKLTESKIKGIPLGGFEAIVGPITNPNFPYVVLGRFIYLYQQIKNKNHADRGALGIRATDFQQQVGLLEKSSKSKIHNACRDLSRQKVVENLNEVLIELL